MLHIKPHILTLALLCFLNFQCTPSKVQVVNPLLIEIENPKFLREIDKFVSDTHIENPQKNILRVFILSNDCSGTRCIVTTEKKKQSVLFRDYPIDGYFERAGFIVLVYSGRGLMSYDETKYKEKINTYFPISQFENDWDETTQDYTLPSIYDPALRGIKLIGKDSISRFDIPEHLSWSPEIPCARAEVKFVPPKK